MDSEVKCHGDVSQGGVFRFDQPSWQTREREPYVTGMRQCSYCGSLNPEDLLAALKAGTVQDIHGADWKYGWPHKFYVDVPNQIAGKVTEMGSSSGPDIGPDTPGAVQSSHGYWKLPTLSPAPATCHAKFYNTHLQDVSDEVFAELAPLLLARTGIEFTRDPEKGVGWRAPAHGHQR